MKSIALSLIMCISLTISNVFADQSVAVGEASIAFLLPGGWEKSSNNNQSPPTMDASNPLSRAWKYKPYQTIVNSNGQIIEPGLNVTAFKVPPDANIALISSALMRKRGWPFIKFLTSETDGLSMPNSLGYLTEFSENAGTKLSVFVIHAINNGKFVEIILSTTSETFQLMESNFRSIIHSIHVDIDRPPITLEKIESILPPDVTIASVTAVPFGAQVGICTRNTVLGMKLLKSVEESIGLFQLTNITRLKPRVQIGQMIKPIRFDFLIYGDTSHLVSKQDDKSCP